MDRLVLDASVTLSWLFNDEEGSPDAILRESKNFRLFASSIWPIEVCNIANKAHQKGRVGASELKRFWFLLKSIPVSIDTHSLDLYFVRTEIQPFSEKHGLTVYDASYLELSTRLACPLATLDKKLREAANQEGVRLYLPG